MFARTRVAACFFDVRINRSMGLKVWAFSATGGRHRAMHDLPLLVVMAKAPVCGSLKTRLARDIGAVAAASLARTLCASLLREAARDTQFRTMLAVTPDNAIHARFASWRVRHPGTARQAVSGIAKNSLAWRAVRPRISAQALSGATISPPHPVPLSRKLALASLPVMLPASASGCGWERERTHNPLPLRERVAAGEAGRRVRGRADIVRMTQGRGGLGARMQRIFDVCGRGPVIVVGTDIPFVTREIVARAFRQLRGADAVFGAAEDGGYWLVGLRRRPRTLSPFENVRWSSPHALADTLANLRGRRVAFADTLFDIDTLADYRRFMRQGYR
jgi:glycosyltransferase A (GT-A) superfamily protein (DUF2064 family)